MKRNENGFTFEVGDRVQFTEDTIMYYEDPESLFYQDNGDWTPEKVSDLIEWMEFEVIKVRDDQMGQLCTLEGLPDGFSTHWNYELEPVNYQFVWREDEYKVD